MRGKWLVFAAVALFTTTSSLAQLSIGGVLNVTDRSTSLNSSASLMVSAVSPKSGDELGVVRDGIPIATQYVSLRLLLTLDNIELRGSVDRLVDAMLFDGSNRQPEVETLKPIYSVFKWEYDKTQPRVFKKVISAGSLKPGGYVLKIRIWGAKVAQIGQIDLGNANKVRSGQFVETSFHFAVRQVNKPPTTDWEMAAQLQGFNLLVEQPDAPAPTRTEVSKQEQKSESVSVETKAVKNRSVEVSIKAIDAKTGQAIDYSGRFALTISSVAPDRKEVPGFQPDESGPEGVLVGKLSKGAAVVTANVPADRDVWLIAWIQTVDGWSFNRSVRLDPGADKPEFRFRLATTPGGGAK